MSRPASKPAARSRRATAVVTPAERETGRGSALESRTVSPPRPQRLRRDSDIQDLTVPPDERPSRNNLPGSIEEAVLAMLDQVPRTVSVPPPRAEAAAAADADVAVDER